MYGALVWKVTVASRGVQGFILDGFPCSEAQAQLLERAVTGLNLAAEATYHQAASKTAPPPDSCQILDRPLTSCLDTAFVLQLDDADEAIDRAVSRRMKPEQKGETPKVGLPLF